MWGNSVHRISSDSRINSDKDLRVFAMESFPRWNGRAFSCYRRNIRASEPLSAKVFIRDFRLPIEADAASVFNPQIPGGILPRCELVIKF